MPENNDTLENIRANGQLRDPNQPTQGNLNIKEQEIIMTKWNTFESLKGQNSILIKWGKLTQNKLNSSSNAKKKSDYKYIFFFNWV